MKSMLLHSMVSAVFLPKHTVTPDTVRQTVQQANNKLNLKISGYGLLVLNVVLPCKIKLTQMVIADGFCAALLDVLTTYPKFSCINQCMGSI